MTWQLNPNRVLYLNDPAPTKCRTAITSFHLHADGLATVELEQTPFYPQSGGQPADCGTICWTTGSLIVQKVLYSTSGDVRHLGRLCGAQPSLQSVADAAINVAVRAMHTRLHTAGELICAAMIAMGHDWPVSGAKHFPGDSRVVFKPSHPTVGPLELRTLLAQKLIDLVASNASTTIRLFDDREEAQHYTVDASELPYGVNLYRIVIVHGGRGRPCTGTHVTRLGEVGVILLRSVKFKKAEIVVSYDVNDISTKFDGT